jgi:hypothetical protein
MKNIKYILPIYIMISGYISHVHAKDSDSVKFEKFATVKQTIFPVLIENLGGFFKPEEATSMHDAFHKLTNKQKKEFLSNYNDIIEEYKNIIAKKIDFRCNKIREDFESKTMMTDEEIEKVRLMKELLEIPVSDSGAADFIVIAVEKNKGPNVDLEDAMSQFLSLDKNKKVAVVRKANRNIALKVHPDHNSKNMELAKQAFVKLTDLTNYTEEYLKNN